jgi:hypothetical protein
MQNNVTRLHTLAAQMTPDLAQDGGLPLRGLLSRVTPELRESLLKEFFLK